MVSRTTMVTDSSGAKITLFESLRQAIRDIVSDKRLIKEGSRLCFITFGTKVEEKKTWPESISSDKDRQKLIDLIEDQSTLKADRIGDTYMGGALSLALAKAIQFRNQSDPCTTNFILMLTDGWDEPPKDAKYDVREVARKVVSGQKEVKEKIGIDTWQIAVIGLKQLPKMKEGTTTAEELATLLNGTFLDVTREKGKSVSSKIYAGLSKILLNQRGRLTLVNPFELINFGSIDGDGKATASIALELNACDKEEISSIRVANKVEQTKLSEYLEKASSATEADEKIVSLTYLDRDALIVESEKEKYLIEPKIDENGKRFSKIENLKITAKAGSKLPVGKFLGCLELVSSARVPDYIPFLITAPARLTAKDDLIDVKLRREGFFRPKAVDTTFDIEFQQAKGTQKGAVYEISAQVEPLVKLKRNGKPKKPKKEMPAKYFNDGKPISITFDTNKEETSVLKCHLRIPPKAKPGTYKGFIKLDIKGPPEMAAPKEVPILLSLKPTKWEQVAPIAIPMFILLIIGVAFYIFMAMKSYRD